VNAFVDSGSLIALRTLNDAGEGGRNDDVERASISLPGWFLEYCSMKDCFEILYDHYGDVWFTGCSGESGNTPIYNRETTYMLRVSGKESDELPVETGETLALVVDLENPDHGIRLREPQLGEEDKATRVYREDL
jgi:hypothetical protein